MFTGIIESTATITELRHRDDGSVEIVLDAGPIVADLPQGGSLAVNGVCLTAVPPHDQTDPSARDAAEGTFTADVMGETLRMTSLGDLRPGDTVNLERCLRATDRLDGHVVQGHADGVATLSSITNQGSWAVYRFSIPAEVAPFVALKGAIALDGISLTVSGVSPADAAEHWVEVSLIPATRAHTTLGAATVGRRVNVEADVLAKYAARLAEFPSA